LAVPPFVLLAFMDYAARQQWSYATMLNRVYAIGLPLEDDENAASAGTQTMPRVRIESDRLKDAYSKRPKPSGTPNVSEPFQPVDTIEESIHSTIKPKQIDDAVQADLFRGIGPGKKTLEAEVLRLKTLVPEKIEAAAEEYVKGLGTEEKKKAAAENLLLPLAWSTKNVEELKSKIDAAGGAKLDELVKEAALRRMLVDLLAPLNVFRPAAPKDFQVEKVVDLNNGEFVYPLAKLNELLVNRFDEAIAPQHLAMFQSGDPKRDDIEKRHAIGFLLFSVSRLKAPGAKTPLVDNSEERAQVVSGLYEFAQAAANYVRTQRVLYSRKLYAITTDRDGNLVYDKTDPNKVLTRTNSFMDEHATDIQRLKRLAAEIDVTNKRLKDLEDKRKRYQTQLEERTNLRDEVTARLVESRGETKKILDDIHRLEQDIFDAQKKLSNAAERNARLERQIEQSEQLLLKGGKK
jgi:DNA repair exonuclease SbcCD ATPase subunit